MYDYTLGKVDWMAYGRPVEGKRGPYIGSAMVDIATCRADEPAPGITSRAAVVTGERVTIGLVTPEMARDAPEGATALDVMEVMADTLRPNVLLEDVDSRVAGWLVTTPEGELLGAVDPDALQEHEHES